MELNDVYMSILNDIYDRCLGDVGKMTLVDKINYKSIMIEFKKVIDEYLNTYYPVMQYWEQYDITKDINKGKEPDLIKLENLFENVKVREEIKI